MNFPFSLPNISPLLLFALFAWTLVWKGVALWKASKNDQRNWFILLLVVNTIGLLEIVFLFFFCKNKLTIDDLKIWKKL